MYDFYGVDIRMKTLEQLVEAYGLEWDTFTELLEENDREAFVGLIQRAKHLAEAGSKIENPNMFESVVMSILVEQQRELSQLHDRLSPRKTKTCPRCSRTSSLEDFLKANTVDEGVSILCQHCRDALCFVNENR
jgi:phosphoribosyl-dephospho-CoA transferase